MPYPSHRARGNQGNKCEMVTSDEQGYLGELGGSDTTRLYYAVNQVAGVRTVSFAVSSDQGTFNGSFVMQYHGQDPANPIDNVTWTRYLHADGLSNPSATVSTLVEAMRRL